MDINLPAGRYVVAVSGGVDSMALLHILSQQPGVRLTVAHFDHGIREDSVEDRKLVEQVAKDYGLPFVYHQGNLGAHASEAKARDARYAFLYQVKQSSGAHAIVTAHHQDDVLETAILNLLRGTGSRGLSSLRSTDVIKRPLLHVPKKELLRYAEREGLRWREDSTNADERYLRNYIRARILPRFAEMNREALLAIISRAQEANAAIAEQVAQYLHVQPGLTTLDRYTFIQLPHAVARAVMAEWLLLRADTELSRRLLERLVVTAKTARAGTKTDVDAGHWLQISQTELALIPRER